MTLLVPAVELPRKLVEPPLLLVNVPFPAVDASRKTVEPANTLALLPLVIAEALPEQLPHYRARFGDLLSDT